MASTTHPNPSRLVAITVDGSETSKRACHWAIANFLDPKRDQVILINARPFAQSMVPYVGIGEEMADWSQELAKAEEQTRLMSDSVLLEASTWFQSKNIHCKGVSVLGEPREVITKELSEMGVNTCIVGSRGLGPLKGAMLGSVSDHLVHHLHCPVIIVQ